MVEIKHKTKGSENKIEEIYLLILLFLFTFTF